MGHRLGRPTPAIQGESIADGLPLGLRPQKLEEELSPNPQASSSRLLGPAGRKDSKKASLNDRPGEASRRQLTLARRPAAGLPVWLKPPLAVALNAAGRAKPQPSAQGSSLIPKLQPLSPGSSIFVPYWPRPRTRVRSLRSLSPAKPGQALARSGPIRGFPQKSRARLKTRSRTGKRR